MSQMTSKSNSFKQIDGILLVNKPYGMTSNAVLQHVKRLYGAKKAGHTGSLDPMATGMLPLCFGEATKFCQYLLDADKCYEATGHLGIKTNSGDAMGEVTARTESFNVTKAALQAVILQFTGHIKQVPSMFSALKHNGTPLYKLARAGVTIERQARDVSIHQLQLNHFDGQQFMITVTCSKGTYIRNLIEDMGDQLKAGAHVTRLHRSYTAGFADEHMYTFEELQQKSPEERLSCLLPMERAVSCFPQVVVNCEQVLQLRQGKMVEDLTIEGQGTVRLYEPDNRFFGLGEWHNTGLLKAKRLLAHPDF